MSKRAWAQAALETLQAGQLALVKPKGHSMRGKVNEGDSVVISPCRAPDLAVGDIVLAHVKGHRYFHLVLHLIIARDGDHFLIGNNFGRHDGWIAATEIFGKVREIYPAKAHEAQRHELPNKI